jgi:hypothetical protein
LLKKSLENLIFWFICKIPFFSIYLHSISKRQGRKPTADICPGDYNSAFLKLSNWRPDIKCLG